MLIVNKMKNDKINAMNLKNGLVSYTLPTLFYVRNKFIYTYVNIKLNFIRLQYMRIIDE